MENNNLLLINYLDHTLIISSLHVANIPGFRSILAMLDIILRNHHRKAVQL